MKKVTDQELKELQDLQGSLLTIISKVGELTLSKSLLLKEIKNIEANLETEQDKFVEFQKKERVIFETMQQKYGTGNIDVTTGEILA